MERGQTLFMKWIYSQSELWVLFTRLVSDNIVLRFRTNYEEVGHIVVLVSLRS